MKKQCENILLYLDEELKEKERKEFTTHLESCEECQSFLTSFKDNYMHISSPVAELEPDQKQELWQNIESSLKSTMNHSWLVSKKWLIAASIALFALNIFNVYTMFQNKNVSNSQTQIAYESFSEDWYEYSAIDNMIYDLSVDGGESNE